MNKLFRTAESVAWSMVGLAVLMVLLFWVLHLASNAPVVGGAATGAAPYISGSAYGY